MKEKQNANDKNKNGLIFTANTHPSPNFIVDDGVLKMIKGNATLKVYMVIIRHTVGFGADNIHLSNSTIAEKTKLALPEVRRVQKELRDKYKLIHYESTNGGRAIKNIKILLPERFYSKEIGNELDTIKDLESKGYTVIPPSKKGDKPLQVEITNGKNNSFIAEWNNFVLFAKKNLTRSSLLELDKIKVETNSQQIILNGKLSDLLKETITRFFEEKTKITVSIIFKEGDK